MMSSEAFLEQIQEQFDKDFPFVVYRKPNETVVKALLQDGSDLHWVSDFSESGFVFAPFDDEQKSILIPSKHSKSIQCEFSGIDIDHVFQNIDKESQEQKQFHTTLVQKAIHAIESGEFQKVVISRKETVRLKKSDPIGIFKNLLGTYQSTFVYFFFHPKVGLWLGATPETLLKIDGNRLMTMALAGTQKFNGTMDVVWQDKEKDEQQFVTDFIIKNLKSSVETIETSEVQTVRAGNLLHLKTDVSAKIDPATFHLGNLLKNIHPTPAVCGLPKSASKQFILKNEHYHREFYTGFLGELNIRQHTPRNTNRHNTENNAYASIKTVSNLYVNLRCMQLKDNQSFIYVGGGITKDSDPEKEWEETVSKSKVIKSIL